MRDGILAVVRSNQAVLFLCVATALLTLGQGIAVPIVEGMGYWAVNPEKVGAFNPIPGRHEFGDVFERMPRPEQKAWQ